jgi:hypothetical protein
MCIQSRLTSIQRQRRDLVNEMLSHTEGEIRLRRIHYVRFWILSLR